MPSGAGLGMASRSESKTMHLKLHSHTSMSDCPFVINGFYTSICPKMVQPGQCQEVQSKDKGIMVIK